MNFSQNARTHLPWLWLVFFGFAINYSHNIQAHEHHEHSNRPLEERWELQYQMTSTIQEFLSDPSLAHDRERQQQLKDLMEELWSFDTRFMDHNHTSKSCDHQFSCRKLWHAITSILLKPISWTQALSRTIQDQPFKKLLTLYHRVEAYTVRIWHGYDPRIVFIILLSQGTWEVVESLIMPAGVHVACTAFNAALLAAVLPLQRLLNFFSIQPDRTSLMQRTRRSVRAFLRSLILTKPKQTYEYLIPNLRHKMQNILAHRNDFQYTALHDALSWELYFMQLHKSLEQLAGQWHQQYSVPRATRLTTEAFMGIMRRQLQYFHDGLVLLSQQPHLNFAEDLSQILFDWTIDTIQLYMAFLQVIKPPLNGNTVDATSFRQIDQSLKQLFKSAHKNLNTLNKIYQNRNHRSCYQLW